MEVPVSSNAKLALFSGALAGPMSVVALVLVGAARGMSGDSISTSPLELIVVATVGLFVGVIVSAVAGLPVLLLLDRYGIWHPALVAAWGAVLGGLAYHALFMWGSAVDWIWVLTGALAGGLAGGTSAMHVQRQLQQATGYAL